MSQETVLALRNEFINNTPDVWKSIRRRIAEEVSSRLLEDLDRLPSCEGRILSELKKEMIEETNISVRIGA